MFSHLKSVALLSVLLVSAIFFVVLYFNVINLADSKTKQAGPDNTLFTRENSISVNDDFEEEALEEKTSSSQQLSVFGSLDWKGWFTLGVLFFTILALILEVRPPDIIMLFASGTLVIFGILPPRIFLDGFSEDILMTIAMLCIVIRTIETNGLISVLANHMLSSSSNESKQLISLILPVAGASAFMNNTPIVLLMTPIVRRWALKNNQYPSKYLIPLSYAAILGGMCTIIGTSTNIVVSGLIKQETNSPLEFFELAYIGVPCLIGGTLLLLTLGRWLIPERMDTLSTLKQDSKKCIAEFLVEGDSPLADKHISSLSRKYFRDVVLLQIQRGNIAIDAPGPDVQILAGDRLAFAGDINHIAQLHMIKGVSSFADPHFKLNPSSSHFSEIVISQTSLMIGKTLRRIDFRKKYGASVMAVYREGERVKGSVPDIEIRSGDTLMLLSSEEWRGGDYFTKDFYTINVNQKLHVLHPWRIAFILVVLLFMVVAATFGISIMVASMAAVSILVLTKMITIREAQNSIIWNVLLLIGSSFALAKSLEITGVALMIAQTILSIVGDNPVFLLSGVLLTAIIATEILSNNAAALILFPIAVQAAKLAGMNDPMAFKSFGVAIAVGCSAGFAIPTGYQTHLIVMGEGGYRFTDFLKVGVPMDILVWALGTALIPILWPIN